jgi:biopolymer transport protein ExbD
MKSVLEVCLIAFIMTFLAAAQEPAKPPLRQGISVQMPVANHLVEMPAADEQGATVVTVTANGKVFLGVQPVEVSALSGANQRTTYLKVDARAPYQRVLTVLDALRGHPIVLLAAPASEPSGTQKIVPPYGMKVTVGAQ